jgi:Flp pilus assembly protein TadG
MNPNLSRQRGAVAIMVAVSMLVLLAVVGLCVDAGLAYLVKARLNAAVDSAALAGARAVTTGNNQTEQIASARAGDLFGLVIAGRDRARAGQRGRIYRRIQARFHQIRQPGVDTQAHHGKQHQHRHGHHDRDRAALTGKIRIHLRTHSWNTGRARTWAGCCYRW